MRSAENRLHPIDSRAHLFEVANVGPNAQGRSTRMFNLKFRDIQFRLAPRQKPNSRASRGKSHSQTLPDTAPGARDQDAFLFHVKGEV
jgi:hypothetical protein